MTIDKCILFLNPLPIDEKKSNLFRKFQSQVRCAGKIFERVFYTEYDEEHIYLREYESDYKYILGDIDKNSKNYVIVSKMVKYLNSWLTRMDIDYLYMRNSAPTLEYFKTFSQLKKKGTKIIVEIPTYPGTSEGKNSSRKFHYFMNDMFFKLFGNVYRKNVSLYALIGEQASSYNGVPAINIQNGLNIDEIPLKNGFENHVGQIDLLIVAKPTYWHGYDRLLVGLGKYYKLPHSEEIHVHICGKSTDGTIEKFKEIASEYNIENYVHFDGYLSGNQLIDMFNKCDIAIGSLGLFRQNIIIDTTLKIPEYTARGIPFVYCTPSENIDKDTEYSLKIPENETSVDINEIIEFYKRLDKKRVSDLMRQYALDNLDWSNQLETIVNYFEEEK